MGKIGKKKHKKAAELCCRIGDSEIRRAGSIDIKSNSILVRPPGDDGIPESLRLNIHTPGVFFGKASQWDEDEFIGMSQGEEGNIIVIGSNGSGKSASIAKPTSVQFHGAICATDVKGELSDFYEEMYQQGHVIRPYLVFDPMNAESISYDPFDWLLQDDEAHLVSNIWEIVLAIHPTLLNDNQPFWAETERGVLTAALLYYFKSGFSFSETIISILAQPVSDLCEELTKSGDVRVRLFLGETAAMKPETLANIDRGLRNKLMLFAADQYISHAFRGRREGANCFTWDDLNTHNIFLRIPADKIDEWGGAINLMYTQLIRYLERRPEKYSAEGVNNVQTLLLMDEFARFGKLEMITAAIATLRSKNVNICLMVQSVAQLDKIYGEYDRRSIFDNCQYRVILRANDADTQKYLAELIGTGPHLLHSISETFSKDMDTIGCAQQISETHDWKVPPHELSTLNDVLLLTPHGFCRVDKVSPTYIHDRQLPCPPDNVAPSTLVKPLPENRGARMLTIKERLASVNRRSADVRYQREMQLEEDDIVES